MDDLAQLYRRYGPSGHRRSFNDGNDKIVVIEMRRVTASGLVDLEVLELEGPDKDTWLLSETAGPGSEIVLQLLQVAERTDVSTGDKYLDISQSNFHAVLQKLRLDYLLDYGTSAAQMFTSATDGSGDDLRTSSVTHVDDFFTMFYRHDHGAKLTRGVYWNNGQLGCLLEEALSHQKTLIGHPFFLNLCMAVALGTALDSKLCAINDEISSVERRTGFKVWEILHFKPADGDLHTLSARAAGNSSALAAMKRANRVVEQLLKSSSSFQRDSPDFVQGFGEIAERVAACTLPLLQRNESQLIFLEFSTMRVANQLTALFHLIAQMDNKVGISLAEDSKMIAEASKRDSSSMKTLAAVTVLFLPGTFVASLFSTPIFDWQAESAGLILNQHFWIYWVVSLPLTLLTIGAWALWTRIDSSSYRAQEARFRA